MIYFLSAPIPVGHSIEKRGFCVAKVPSFCVLIRRLYAGHELVVWSVEWLTEPVYARPDRVMAMHNGTMEAPDS
jgi:hypothetical protein